VLLDADTIPELVSSLATAALVCTAFVEEQAVNAPNERINPHIDNNCDLDLCNTESIPSILLQTILSLESCSMLPTQNQ
jgi:hypothetical protein